MKTAQITIPTYPVGEPNKNPLFLEKRVYQGSSGKIYPLPFTDKIFDNKEDKTYDVILLENEYLLVILMPSMGGKIYRALDKTNNYDFVYYNEVVKPALVGLTGPWVSGGIEFNWPQHHRPTTFSPVEYQLEEHADGSITCWMGEVDPMYGTKGMAGFTLYEDKGYIEIRGQLYNRTETPQTFLWWANPAVAVNDYTQSIFPPDVHAVFDHGKRDVSKFPIATGEYYKMDYSAGVDISKYKNIPVPTSYMAYHSDYNFVGGYDFEQQAGILHIANHHISPGKKQWTWGHGDFGQAWDRNLTDNNGPYIELMTGVYTDNQPDFTWLAPMEEKRFVQYFMPYKGVGMVKNANLSAVIGLESSQDTLRYSLYTPQPLKDIEIRLTSGTQELHREKISTTTPKEFYSHTVNRVKDIPEHLYRIEVLDVHGNEIISYQPTEPQVLETPDPAEEIPAPDKIKSVEELHLAAIHLEQYRHATYLPEDYYKEGLHRDPHHTMLNNSYGLLLYRRGLYKEAEKHFRRAIVRLTKHAPNPYNGEPYYNLGLTLKRLGNLEEAYGSFYKSTWNDAFQSKGYAQVATIDMLKGEYDLGLEHIEKSLSWNGRNIQGRNLKSVFLLKLNRLEESLAYTEETHSIDPLDYGSTYLLSCIKSGAEQEEARENFFTLMRENPHNFITAAEDFKQIGVLEEAVAVLELAENELKSPYPMISYLSGYYQMMMGFTDGGSLEYKKGSLCSSDYCFPHRLDELDALTAACSIHPDDAKAHYYVGNLLYDKKQYDKAIHHWELSCTLDDTFPTSFRNLALAYVNKRDDTTRALPYLEKAFALNREDGRVLFELDQLYKKIGKSAIERVEFLEKHLSVTESRDDLYVEYITLLNRLNRYEEAKSCIDNRIFHPWEGGEGKVSSQYKRCRIELAKSAILHKDLSKAKELLNQTLYHPHNLGEGKLQNAADNEIYYFLGLVEEQLGNSKEAEKLYLQGSTGIDEPRDAMFYNDQPADMMFYQGLALRKLGNEDKAKSEFNRIYDFGEKHLHCSMKIDYFAVSLPDFLVFDENLDIKNRVHCLYLMGLGQIGIGNYQRGMEFLKEAYALNPNHQGVELHKNLNREFFM